MGYRLHKTEKIYNKQLTREQTQHNQTLRERIELVKYNTEEQTWACAITNCTQNTKTQKQRGNILQNITKIKSYTREKPQTAHTETKIHQPRSNADTSRATEKEKTM